MVFEVFLITNLHDITFEAITIRIVYILFFYPVVFWKRVVECNVKLEVREFLFDGPEVIYVK